MDELALMNAVDQRDKKRQGYEHEDIETQRFYDELASELLNGAIPHPLRLRWA